MSYNNSTFVIFDINSSGVNNLSEIAIVHCLPEKMLELRHNYPVITNKIVSMILLILYLIRSNVTKKYLGYEQLFLKL